MLLQGWVGVLNQKHTRAYKVGGLVKNVTVLGVCTFWMIPRREVFCKRGSLYFPHQPYVSFFPFAF